MVGRLITAFTKLWLLLQSESCGKAALDMGASQASCTKLAENGINMQQRCINVG